MEDDVLLREQLDRFLSASGLAVDSAGTLAEALALMAERRYAASIVDVGLPDGNGLSLLPQLGPERAVVTSARPDPSSYAAWNVRHQLAKPFDLSTLLRAIDVILAAPATG